MSSFALATPSPTEESRALKSRKKPRLTANFVDLVGQRFGRLTVSLYAGRSKHGNSIWLCLCECGGEARTGTTKLRSGHTTSCGCLQQERTRAAATRHGMLPRGVRHPLLDTYSNILDRCYNAQSEYFDDYGGRGITVCDRWRFGENGKTGFQCFVEDAGERPEGLTLDRRDNDGHYSPSNIRWASRKEQARNRRSNLLIPIGDEMVSVAEFSERTGLNYGTVISRIRHGWHPSLLGSPLQRQGRRL